MEAACCLDNLDNLAVIIGSQQVKMPVNKQNSQQVS